VKFLELLNQDQLQAVKETEGPVLIVAGAGTGKTRVITNRIAYLIKTHPELDPSNILGLTFSRKASAEMLKRVEALIGQHKDELWILTIHGFANRILRDYSHLANLPRNFKLLNRPGQWLLLKDILPQAKLKYFLNISDPDSVIDDILRFISRAKDELISPEELLRYGRDLEDKEERERLSEACQIYRLYQQELKKRGELDFNDLIVQLCALLEKNQKLRGLLQDKFKYILVDEFQDTNVAQIELIQLLSARDKNICVVGDDDQGIYRFRGASYTSFVKFKEYFPKARSFRLTQNYRSTEKILSGAGELIKYNEPDRYDPDKVLWTTEKGGLPITSFVAEDYQAESYAIAEEISRLLKDNVPPEDIAVLYRAHSHKNILLDHLRQQEIPCQVVSQVGAFEQDEIIDILSLLRVIDNPHDTVSLFRVLSIECFDIAPDKLIKLSQQARAKKKSLYDILEDKKELINSLVLYNLKNGLRDLLPVILEETNYLKAILENNRLEDTEKLNNISRLADFIREFYFSGRRPSLKEFLEYLDFFIKSGGELPRDETPARLKAIQFMSVHQAKGLEFPYVFVIGLVQGRFPTRRRPERIPFPAELMKEFLPQGDFHLQEERRLFYVAMTRAEKALYLSSVKAPYKKPSVFVNEIGARGFISKEIEDYPRVAVLKNSLKKRLEKIVALPMTTDELKLSYTQLDTYQTCPLQYKYRYLLGLPSKVKPHLYFGSLIHQLLENYGRQKKEGTVLTIAEMEKILADCWDKDFWEDKFQETEYKKEAKRIIKQFCASNKDLSAPLYVEEEFLLDFGDSVRLKGVIDRVDKNQGKIEIIDYKTSRSPKNNTKFKGIQLNLYCLALERLFDLKVGILSYYYLRDNKKISELVSEEGVRDSEDLVKKLSQLIKKGEFEAKPGWPCRSCDYKITCPFSLRVL